MTEMADSPSMSAEQPKPAQVVKKKSVLSLAAAFEQDTPPPMPKSTTTTTYNGRRSFSRSLTDPHNANQTAPSEPGSSPPAKRVPVIIPKTFSDMKKAGEPLPSSDSPTSTRHFQSLKLSRFNDFKEQHESTPIQHSTSADLTLSTSNHGFDEYKNDQAPLSLPQLPISNSPSSPRSPSRFITRSISSSSSITKDHKSYSASQSFPYNTDADMDHNSSPPFEDVLADPTASPEPSATPASETFATTYEAPTNLPPMHAPRPSSASQASSTSSRAPSVTLKPIIKEVDTQEDENIIFAVCVVGFHHIRYVLSISHVVFANFLGALKSSSGAAVMGTSPNSGQICRFRACLMAVTPTKKTFAILRCFTTN